MTTPILILVLFLYAFLEFLSAFLFNIKIKMINKQRYNVAATLGAGATILFTFLSLLAPMIALTTSSIWFIFVGALMMALGNSIAVIAVKPFNEWRDRVSERKTNASIDINEEVEQ